MFVHTLTVSLLLLAANANRINQALQANKERGDNLWQKFETALSSGAIDESRKLGVMSDLAAEVSGLTRTPDFAAPNGFRSHRMSYARVNINVGGNELTTRDQQCCMIDTTVIQVHSYSVSRTQTCPRSYQSSYKTKCGKWSWRRCRRTRTSYRAETCYYSLTRYRQTTNRPPCPNQHKTCCARLMYVKPQTFTIGSRSVVISEGACVSIDEMCNIYKYLTGSTTC